MEINDEYHEAIDQGDIDILRNSAIKVAVTPFAALLGMYALFSLKNEVGKSTSFAYQIRGAQDKLMKNNYGRQANKEDESTSFEESATTR